MTNLRALASAAFRGAARPLHAAVWVFLAALCGMALPAYAAERYEHGLLWRIQGGNAPPSHVFGTVHLADPRVTRLPPAVAHELDGARSLTVEARLDPGGFEALADRMLYRDGRVLPEVAGAELFGRAATHLAAFGIPESALRPFKPWAVALLLSVPPQNPAEVLDMILVRLAQEQNKPVHALESMEEQALLFDGISQDDQVTLMREAVDGYERLPQLIGRVIEAYLARDLAGLSRLRAEMGGDEPRSRRLREEINRRLLVERNARMAERAESRLREGGTFIAVGALHLYGGSGLLALLEKRGWRVTRVY